MNKKGLAEVALLGYIIFGLILFFVPNPISNTIGVGIRPNKTVSTETIELIKDKDGVPIAYKRLHKDNDIQQHVTFWEWLTSLPIFVLLLMALGVVFPPISLFLHNLWTNLKKDTKKIVVGVDKALDSIHDPVVKQVILDKMDGAQDESTKRLVDSIQGKK